MYKGRVILVDGLNLFTRHFMANPAMSENGDHVGGIVGFFNATMRLIEKCKPEGVVVVWEGGGSVKKRGLYKDYKQKSKPQNLNRFYEDEIPSTYQNRNNQIKTLYIQNGGSGYASKTYNIIGDGTGGRVAVTCNSAGTIIETKVVSGGTGYTFGIVDLESSGTVSNPAKLIPIIPPSRGHGYDIYTEPGADKVLIYARFDDSTKDFPTDTKFTQVGIIKNPQKYNSSEIFTNSEYSSLGSIKLSSVTSNPVVGTAITQTVSTGVARGYVASYDTETKVLKYYQDRSLYFANGIDQTDRNDVSSKGKVLTFESSAETIIPYGGSIDIGFSGITTVIGTKQVSLGVTFSQGLANPEINKNTGDIIYIDNRSLVTRDSRQKEDIKIILEF